LDISGKGATVALAKTRGTIALDGDIHVTEGATLRFDESNQVSRKIVITFNDATLSFLESSFSIINVFRRIDIDSWVDGSCFAVCA